MDPSRASAEDFEDMDVDNADSAVTLPLNGEALTRWRELVVGRRVGLE
jgi:hypothetical protein